MKSRRILAVLAACTAVTFTGCGVVTVVPIGEEASYTGKQEFDSAAESQGDWGNVVADISGKAQNLTELLNGDGITETTAVKGTGKTQRIQYRYPETLSGSRVRRLHRNNRGSGPYRWTELQYCNP